MGKEKYSLELGNKTSEYKPINLNKDLKSKSKYEKGRGRTEDDVTSKKEIEDKGWVGEESTNPSIADIKTRRSTIDIKEFYMSILKIIEVW